MHKRIFEYAVLLHPTHEETQRGVSTEMLVQPTFVLASDITTATILASRSIPDAHLDKLDRVEVAVRPF